MTDLCWMAAHLLVDCVTSPTDQAMAWQAIAPEVAESLTVTEARDVAPGGGAIAPTIAPAAPEFLKTPACEVPTMAVEPGSSCDFHGLPDPEPVQGLAKLMGAHQRSWASPHPPRPVMATEDGTNLTAPSLRPMVWPPTDIQPQPLATPTTMVGAAVSPPEFSRPRPRPLPGAIAGFPGPRPASGSQLYQQRLAALQAGQLYTRLVPSSFQAQWQPATDQPTDAQWRSLLAREAQVLGASQGSNRLTVVVGDSLSLWLPTEFLPRDRFWLNQSISGDTTAGILQRLHYFAATRPTTIQMMAGINDLKNGASDAQVVSNIRQILIQLRRQHPQAHIVVHSILPTRWGHLSGDRIRGVNRQIAAVARQEGVEFVDLQHDFSDDQGNLSRSFTTDGLHLNRQGYQVWQRALSQR